MVKGALLAQPKSSPPGRQKVAQQPGVSANRCSREQKLSSPNGRGTQMLSLGAAYSQMTLQNQGSNAKLNQRSSLTERQREA